MLGKLIKQEWRSTWKVPTLLIGVLVLATVSVSVSVTLPAWDGGILDSAYMAALLLLLFYAVVIGCSWGTVLYLVIRYYKSMYTDEGYLTHTLPVTTHQLLISKALNFWIWNLLSTVAAIVSICGFVVIVSVLQDGDFSLITEIVEGFMKLCEEINASAYALPWQFFLFSMLICMVITSLSGVLLFMGSVNIGQLWARHRVAGAVLVYIGIYIVQQFVAQIMVSGVVLSGMLRSSSEAYSVITTFNHMIWIITLESVLFAVALYIASYFILQKRINVE